MKDLKVGILGGGQLGKMLCQAASRWDLNVHILDQDAAYPAGKVNRAFTSGDFKRYEDVYHFGKDMDIITIEIENVNVEALAQLEKEGKKVFPQPDVIKTIKDKGLQKMFYLERGLPTSPFAMYSSAQQIMEDVDNGQLKLPFVQKLRTEGYDGRGVQVVQKESDLARLFDSGSVVEDLVDIEKEIAVLVARNESGETKVFPSVEMAFHPTANLVEQLISPARIDENVEQRVRALALQVIDEFKMTGLLAIELFQKKDGTLLINEVAPRPHNSGHHTIEANVTSQYEQLIRAVLNLPLGQTDLRSPAVMINVLGAEGYEGKVHYEGVEDALSIPGVNLHLYGKAETKPYRKMGHATIVHENLETAIKNARYVSSVISVISKD